MPKWPKIPPSRNASIVNLHLQGYFNSEIGKACIKQFGYSLSRERIRQIVSESGMQLDHETFHAVRIRRRCPQELIKCACGCGKLIQKYRYYKGRALARRYFSGHYIIRDPKEHRRKIGEAQKRRWAAGIYDNRRPSPRQVANKKKFIAFVTKNPKCTPNAVARATGMTWSIAVRYARELCDIEEGNLPAKYILTLKESIGKEND